MAWVHYRHKRVTTADLGISSGGCGVPSSVFSDAASNLPIVRKLMRISMSVAVIWCIWNTIDFLCWIDYMALPNWKLLPIPVFLARGLMPW